ncbi:MAG: site-specific DNA-methyltransferase [Bacteroidales bacterium]|nr:site-specific DNA-methyltransferase [Bacteroidales bacterium]
MIKDIRERNEEAFAGKKEMEVLRAYFPQCFTVDGEFDIEKFRSSLPEGTKVSDETTGFNFLGKNYARMLTNMDTTTLIRPDVEHNAKPENKDSKNVYISGDNLDALQHLVKSYAGKVKVIYIDPPYNTGSDGFVYNDKFSFTAEELAKRLEISPERAGRILSMTKRGSASHAAWLTFMLPRLSFARDLLTKDGVIFISIDDNEQANLKSLCDEIFGEECFMGNVVRATGQTTGQDSGGLGTSFDYILVYSKNEDYELNGLELTEKDKKRFQEEDDNGFYAYDQLRKTGSNDKREDRPNLYYGITDPDGNILYPTATAGYDSCWRVEKASYENLVKNDMILWKRTTRNDKEVWWPYVKYYLEGRTKRPSPLWNDLEGNKKAAREVRDLFDGKKVFSFPKPVDLLDRIITIATDKNSLIVDFFGGSSTTAHALMKKNAVDNGCRTFILIQLQEPCKEDSEAFKANYRTIDQIGMERIKRAAKKIKDENPLFAGDLGFKHYVLEEPKEDALLKMEQFDPTREFLTTLTADDFGVDSVLRTWLVADGYGLTEDAEEVNLDGYTAYYKEDHLYLINPDDNFTAGSIAALMDKYNGEAFSPQNIVIFGYSFGFTHREELQKNLRALKDGNKSLTVNIDIRY